MSPFSANDDDRRVECARLAIRIASGLAFFVGALLLACLVYNVAEASTVKRSTKARADFHRANPCPVNGKTRGSCPGYVIDHVTPLCAGGADTPANMQWLTAAAARKKDLAWLRVCRPTGPTYHRRQAPAQ